MSENTPASEIVQMFVTNIDEVSKIKMLCNKPGDTTYTGNALYFEDSKDLNGYLSNLLDDSLILSVCLGGAFRSPEVIEAIKILKKDGSNNLHILDSNDGAYCGVHEVIKKLPIFFSKG